ncbi:MAG: 50S ribosomal protein L18 [Phycisphaerales bacterium]|nr:MAG: 50S ribosomal protein L18 [Phycisphaerales bacterium]
MDKSTNKSVRRARRKIGIRKRVSGTAERPRLAVFKSLNHMYAQVIDDLKGHTIVAASTSDTDLKLDKKTGNAAAAAKVGELLAKRAKEKGITDVAFDRGGFRFHGRVKALAEGARKAGLKF